MLKFSVDLDKSMELGLILKKAREHLGLSTSQASQLSSVSTTDINDLENGKRLKINPIILQELSIIYKINVLDLYRVIGYINENDIDNYIEKTKRTEKLMEEIEYQREKFTPIPVFRSVSAGQGAFPEEAPETFIAVPLKNSHNYRAAYIKGDSMYPTFGDKDIVIFDPNIEKLKNKEIGVFYVDGSVFLKRYYSEGNLIALTSDNFAHEPIFITKDTEFRIVGKFIASLKFDG